MSAADDAFAKALHEFLGAEQQLEDGEVITHYVIVTATTILETGEPRIRTSSGPNEEGLPTWQERGLLLEGLKIIDDAEYEVDDD